MPAHVRSTRSTATPPLVALRTGGAIQFQAHPLRAAQLSGQPSDDAVQIAINLVLDRAAALRVIE